MFKRWKLWQKFILYFGVLTLLLVSLAIPSLARLAFGESVWVEGETWMPRSTNPQQLNIQLDFFNLTLDQVDPYVWDRLEEEQANSDFFFSGVRFEETLYLQLITDDENRLIDLYLSQYTPSNGLYLSLRDVYVEVVYARTEDFVDVSKSEIEGVRIIPNIRTNYYPSRQEMQSLQGEDEWLAIEVELVVWRGQAQIRSIQLP